MSRSELETRAAGAALGMRLREGDRVLLKGGLGAGKTVFVKGLARGLGAPEERVVSPTYLYVREVWGGRVPLFHMDAYRLVGRMSPSDARAWMEELGLDGYLDAPGVVALEWPEPVEDGLPGERFLVRLEFARAGGDGASGDARLILLQGWGERPVQVLGELAVEHGWRRESRG